MASHLQLVGSGSRDSHVPAAAAIVFEQSRYLFGAGEGTQRMATEAHMKLAKMKQVFITRIQHEQVGGLTGLLITLADLGIKRIGVHGPGPLRHFLQAARHVSVRSNMTIDAFEVPSPQADTDAAGAATESYKPVFEDSNLAVEAVVVAHQRYSLPPIRTNTGWHHQAPVHHHQPVQTQNGAVELVDPSIDDTPAAGASSTAAIAAAAPSEAQPASPSTAAPPAAKKAKFVHSHSHSGASSSASATAAGAATADSSSVAVAAPAAPRLSYCCVNQSRENERQVAEWTTSTHPALVCYIASLAPTPGKFDVARAKALGIPPGPLYAKLKAGESIQIKPSEMIGGSAVGGPRRKPQQKQQKKGAATTAAPAAAAADEAPAVTVAAPVAVVEEELRTFHPSDCVATQIPGPKFAVIDCPNRAFLQPLVEHPAFRRFQDCSAAPASSSTAAPPSSSSPTRLTLMLHLTPLSLLSHPLYISWLGSFGPGTQHVLANATTSIPRAVFRSAALNYLKLQRYVNAEIFPAQIPVEQDSTAVAERDAGAVALRSHLGSIYPAPARVEPGVSLLRFHLLPPQNQALDHTLSAAPVAYPSEVEANLAESSNPALIARLERWRAAMAEGAAKGLGVQQVADRLKQEMDAEADSSAVVAAAPNVTVAAPPPVMDFPLTPPAALADFHPAADILEQLSAQPEELSPQLTFLGTGSAIPSKYRNVTGQFFHPGYESLPPAGSDRPAHPVGGFFFDCGEGSYGQLCLRYASRSSDPSTPPAHEIVANLVADLKAVWVSHIHADHHLGLLSLLSVYKQTWTARYQAHHGAAADLKQMRLVSPLAAFPAADAHAVPKLLVVGPRRLYFWLKEYAACAFQVGEEDQVDPVCPRGAANAAESPLAPTLWEWVEFRGCSELQDRCNVLSSYFASDSPAIAARYPQVRPRGCTVVQTVQVRHCTDAWGMVIETSSSSSAGSAAGAPAAAAALPPFKLVISGDTQPCQALVDAGADATLLVHEATLEDDMLVEAREKRHSTTGQAVEVGVAMRARRILLTHFSQRYPKIPSYSDSFSSRTCLAFDLMCVRFRALAWLPALTPAFSWLFSEEDLDKYENGKDKESGRNDVMME